MPVTIDTVFEYKGVLLTLPNPRGDPPGLTSFKNKLPLVSRRLEYAERWRKRGIRFDTTIGRQKDFAQAGGLLFVRQNHAGSWRGLVITETPPYVTYTRQAFWRRSDEPFDLTGVAQIVSSRLPHWSWKWRIVCEAATSGLYPISGSGPAGSGSGYVTHEDDISKEGELVNLPSSYSNPEGASSSTRNLQLGMTRDGSTITADDWGPIYWN